MNNEQVISITDHYAIKLLQLLEKNPELKMSDARKKLGYYRLSNAINLLERETLLLELEIRSELTYPIIGIDFKDTVKVLKKGNFEIIRLNGNFARIKIIGEEKKR